MNTVFMRRMVAAAIAGGCIVVIAAFAVGSLRLGIDPKQASLALRVDTSRVRFFLRTADRAFFLKTFNETMPRLVPDTKPLGSSLPESERYELAVLTSGSGSAWIIFVAEKKGTRHQTIVSENNPSLFLPINRAANSLGRSALVREYAGTADASWLYADPKSLPRDPGLGGAVMAGVLAPMDGLLVVFRDQTRGIAVLQGPHPNIFTPVTSAGVFTTPPLFRIDSGSPGSDLESLGTLVATSDPALSDGLKGIARNLLKSLTGRTDIAEFSRTMLAGPMSVVTTRNGATVSVGMIATAAEAQDVDTWAASLDAFDAGSRVRQIVFPKHENVRIDVTPEARTGFRELGEIDGWRVRSIGSTGSTLRLFIAVSGRRYAVASDEPLLKSLIARPIAGGQNNASASGTADVGWLFTAADKSLGTLGPDLRRSIERLTGQHAARAVWSIRPADVGWLVDWSVTRSLPSPAPRSLVK